VVTLRRIRGQDRVIAVLRRALSQGRVPHAYLFCGPAGCGKHTTALALAAALQCTAEPGEGCGACEPCTKIAAGLHPDVVTLERQGAAQTIPVDAVRTQVIARLGLPPHEGAARIFLVEEAGALAGPAANALLKTLEEPPARTHFVLGTTAPEKLLPTIRSRCQRVSFAPLRADLRAELDDDTETAARLAALARRLDEAARGDEPGALADTAAAVAAERADVAATLQLYAHHLHREARAAAEGDELGRAATLSRQAALVLETELAVSQHNAHGQLALEAMLHTLRQVTP
jgi:DNA polymerase III subunit delta'